MTPRPHLKTLDEIERDCIRGLVEVLRMEGIEGVRYALWDMTEWHIKYDPCIWRSRATEEQKRVGLGDVGKNGEGYLHGS